MSVLVEFSNTNHIHVMQVTLMVALKTLAAISHESHNRALATLPSYVVSTIAIKQALSSSSIRN